MDEKHKHSRSRAKSSFRIASGVRVGNYAGAPVIFTSSWVILGALLIVMFAPIARRNWPGIGGWSFGVAGLVVIIFGFSTLIHEMAHAVSAHRLGLKIKSISVTFWGGATQLETGSPTPRARAVISAAGPVSNLLLSLVSYALWQLTTRGSIWWAMLAVLTLVNLFVGLLNLFPALPLDGGGLVEALLWALTRDQYKASRLTAIISQVLGVCLALVPFAWIVLTDKRVDFVILIWCVILGAAMFSTGSAIRRRPRPRRLPHNLFTPVLVINAAEPVTKLPEYFVALDDDDQNSGDWGSARPNHFGPVQPVVGAQPVVVAVRDPAGEVTGWVDPRTIEQVPAHVRATTSIGSVCHALPPETIFSAEPGDTEDWAVEISRLPRSVPGVIIRETHTDTLLAISMKRLIAELTRQKR